MCMTDSGEGQTCGEYWFLVPPDTTVLDTSRPDHQVYPFYWFLVKPDTISNGYIY